MPDPIKYHIYRGGYPISPRMEKFYCYVFAGNGLFKCTVNPRFEASVPLARFSIKSLPPWPAQTRLLIPKIPIRLLNLAWDDARQAAAARPVEQMYHFHYFERGWRVSLPVQTVTASRVSYRGGDDPSIVLDLHSHHNMRAFFSQTDNHDERGCRFYGVMGNIFHGPEIALRVGVWGDYQKVSLKTLFDLEAV